MSEPLPVIYLKKNEDRRIRRGHPWVFSNEVDIGRSAFSDLEPGEAVEVKAMNGATLGSGYVNPNSLISVRLLGRGAAHRLTRSLLRRRIDQALALRARLFDKPYYRLVHGEGDALPGLIVDRYGDVVVVQLGTAGMDRVSHKVVTVLDELLKPKAIVLRNDVASRALEGLPESIECALGTPPEHVEIEENGLRFVVRPLDGQKTGWFYDQRFNRLGLRRYAGEQDVLDVFSYTGGFGINAATAGARHVVCLDASGAALDAVAANARLNGVDDRVEVLQGDAFEQLKTLESAGQRFGLVVVDPPALIPRRKDRAQGTRAYERLNRLAMALLTGDGYLLSASCSYHLSAASLEDAIVDAGRKEGRRLQLLEKGRQGPDHPVRPRMPESEYLKALSVRAISG